MISCNDNCISKVNGNTSYKIKNGYVTRISVAGNVIPIHTGIQLKEAEEILNMNGVRLQLIYRMPASSSVYSRVVTLDKYHHGVTLQLDDDLETAKIVEFVSLRTK